MRTLVRSCFAALTASALAACSLTPSDDAREDDSSLTRKPGPGPIHLSDTINAVAGVGSADGSFDHLLLGMSGGEVNAIDYRMPAFANTGVLTTLGTIVAASAHATPDGFRHFIAAQDDGTVSEVYFKDGAAPGVATIGSGFSSIVGVSSYFASDDYQHVIVLTKDGALTEIYYDPTRGIFRRALGSQPGAIAIGAMEYGGQQHVIVGTNFGGIYDAYFASLDDPLWDYVATFHGMTRFAAFARPGGAPRVVGTAADGVIRTWTLGDTQHATSPTWGQLFVASGTVSAIAGWSQPNGTSHVVVATSDGNVRELLADQYPAAPEIDYALGDHLLAHVDTLTGKTDYACLPGGADFVAIDSFSASPGVLYDPWPTPQTVTYAFGLRHLGAGTAAVDVDAQKSQTIAFVPGQITRGQVQLPGDVHNLVHTLNVYGKCGRVQRSVTVGATKPPPPPHPSLSLTASSTWINKGDKITVSFSANFGSCMHHTLSLSGYAQPPLSLTNLPDSGTLHLAPLSGIDFTLTGTCLDDNDTATKQLTVGMYNPEQNPPPGEQFYCFKVETPASGADPGFCFPVAQLGTSESDAQSTVKSQNPSASVTALSDCTISTQDAACPNNL